MQEVQRSYRVVQSGCALSATLRAEFAFENCSPTLFGSVRLNLVAVASGGEIASSITRLSHIPPVAALERVTPPPGVLTTERVAATGNSRFVPHWKHWPSSIVSTEQRREHS